MATNVLDEIPDLKTVGEDDELAAIPNLKTVDEEELAAIPNLKEVAEVPEISASEAGMLGAAAGFTFDFADELEAAIRSLAPGETYQSAVEKVRARYAAAKEQQTAAYIGGSIAGGTALGFVPGIGPLTTLAKGAGLGKAVAQGAAMGAASGLGESKDITDVADVAKEVATGAAFGAGTVGAIGGIAKGIKALRKPAAEAAEGLGKAGEELGEAGEAAAKAELRPGYRDITSEEEAIVAPLRAQWSATSDELIRVAKEGGELSAEMKEEARQFARNVGEPTKNAIDVVRDYVARLSPEDIKQRIENYKTFDALESRLKELAVDEPGVTAKLRSFLNTGLDFSTVARSIDRRLGTKLSNILLNSTESINKYQVQLRDFLIGKKDVSVAYERLSPELKEELYDALTARGKYKQVDPATGKRIAVSDEEIVAKLPEELRDDYTKWRKVFDEGRDKANQLLGADVITRLANYLPDQMMELPKAIVAIERELKTAAKAMGGEFDWNKWKKLQAGQADVVPTNVDISEIKKAGHPLNSLYRAANYLTGQEPETTKDLFRTLRQAMNPGGDVYTNEIKASALMQRTNLMPDFLKERDIRVLANKWGQQTFRYAYMKNNLDELEQQARYLRAIGAKDDAEKVQRLHDEYLGAARGVADLTRKGKLYFQTRFAKAAENASTPAVKEFYQTLAEAPDVFQNMVLNVYPNFLGASPRAAIQNLTGGLYMMIPELGGIGGYGTAKVLPAYLRAFKNITNKEYIEKLVREGFMPPQWSTELKEAIRTGRPQGMVGRKADELANIVMKGFEWSELMNRAVAYETGGLLAKDAIKGNAKALRYISTMPRSVQQGVLKAVADKNLEQADRLITRYFADRTLFSYNRITSSELSRMVGPLFSMFTKYPSAIAGRVAEDFAEKGLWAGLGELGRFTATPILAGIAINQLFEPGSDAEEILFGKTKDEDTWRRGAVLSSPIFSLQSIAEGRMFTPPLVGAAKETVLGGFELLEGDPERLGRALRNSARAFVPGGAQAIANIAEQLSGEDIPILGKEE
jgi:hypothetical protein